MRLTEELANYLENNFVGLIAAKNVFIESTPDLINDTVTLTEYKGDILGDGTYTAFRNIQIKVRNTDSLKAKELCTSIHLHFMDLYEMRLNDRFVLVKVLQTPFKMSIDDKQRTSYVFNVRLTTDYRR